MKSSYSLRRCTLGLIVACALAGDASAQSPQGEVETAPRIRTLGLENPHHSQAFSQVFYPNALVPDFDRGYLITKVRESSDPDLPNVVLFDRRGVPAVEGKIWFEEAYRLVVMHAAVDGTGGILASGYAWTKEGTLAYFIVRTDSKGAVRDVIRTNPFVPKMLCGASDGTVWSFGLELEKGEKGEDFATLRQYSFSEGELRQFLPHSSFPRGLSPAASWGGANGAFLRCANNRVSLYSNLVDEYIEISAAGYETRRWPVTSPAQGAKALGFAVTDQGSIYASLSVRSRAEGLQLLGLLELELDDEAGVARWVLVPGPMDRGQPQPSKLFGPLLGTDGKNLVFRKVPEGVVWVSPVFRQQD